MAKTANQQSNKRNSGAVQLREKQLKNGGTSFYLDIYVDGKRSYKFLGIYTKPTDGLSSKEKAVVDRYNITMRETAEEAARQAHKDILNEKYNILQRNNKRALMLKDYFQKFIERYEQKGKYVNSYKALYNICSHYEPFNTIRVTDVDDTFAADLMNWMRDEYVASGLRKFSANTLRQKVETLSVMFDGAADEYGMKNPFRSIDKDSLGKKSAAERAYLTEEEVKMLYDTPASNETVKRAFLFACCTGLRISDVDRLDWSNIIKEGDKCHLEIRMKKTSKPIRVPLNNNALSLIGERSTGKVFALPNLNTVEQHVIRWAARAGIRKHVTFHVARHTFATMLLTKGVDLYTVSKLLGHSNITVTQVYAKIIDKVRDEAIEKIDNLF